MTNLSFFFRVGNRACVYYQVLEAFKQSYIPFVQAMVVRDAMLLTDGDRGAGRMPRDAGPVIYSHGRTTHSDGINHACGSAAAHQMSFIGGQRLTS